MSISKNAETDWIERLKRLGHERKYEVDEYGYEYAGHDPLWPLLWPLLCDVVEAAMDGPRGTEPYLDEALDALRDEVERDGD